MQLQMQFLHIFIPSPQDEIHPCVYAEWGRRDVWRPSDWNRTDFNEKRPVVFLQPPLAILFCHTIFVLVHVNMMKGFLCCSLKTGSLVLAVFNFVSNNFFVIQVNHAQVNTVRSHFWVLETLEIISKSFKILG